MHQLSPRQRYVESLKRPPDRSTVSSSALANKLQRLVLRAPLLARDVETLVDHILTRMDSAALALLAAALF